VNSCTAPKTVIDLIAGPQQVGCRFADGSTVNLPAFLGRFIRRAYALRFLLEGSDGVLIERPIPRLQLRYLLYAAIGYVAQPTKSEKGAGFLVRAQLGKCSDSLKSLVLSGDAIRNYFYQMDREHESATLYERLGASQSATPADLRMAWRVRQLELGAHAANAAERAQIERAFNILAHPNLRQCYDSLRRDEDAPPLFPYAGFGSILVEGQLSADSGAFFAHRILAYRPEMTSRRVSLLLRRCEVFADRIVCRDTRRKVEVWLDASVLPGLNWDLTWSHWKHWLQSRIEVNATFVRTGKYRLQKGEWILLTWYAALPSRLRVTMPDGIADDVHRARAIHALLGEHANVVERIRSEVQKQPVEHVQIQDWFDRLGASTYLKPQYVNWHPDYDPYYFEQLRQRSRTWFLFGSEYLFVWPNVLISEVPQLGHATYAFAKPSDIETFMRDYSRATREDIRRNRNNVATQLGFIGRVVRGRKKKRWLTDVLRLAGEKTDYVEVFE
jgi:hypothetical protein